MPCGVEIVGADLRVRPYIGRTKRRMVNDVNQKLKISNILI
jgi:hypothetical protein